MEQHHLETKHRPPQFRRLASDLKDRLRASLNAAQGSGVLHLLIPRATSTAAVGNFRRADGVHPLNSYFDKLSDVQRATTFICLSTKIETSTEFPNAKQTGFPNALEILP